MREGRQERRAAAQRHTVRVLLLSQVLAGAGLAAGISVGALLAEQMLGGTGSAGIPTVLFTLGSAAAALLVGRISQAAGRRRGLAAGYLAGALGSAGVVAAAALDSVALLLPCLALYGAGVATNLQARYAGGDLVGPQERARAMSTVLVATTAGAVLGPNLVDATGSLAAGLGLPRLSGPFMLASVAYGLAGLTVHLLLRPDPLLLASELAREQEAGAADAGSATTTGAAGAATDAVSRTVLLAGGAMVLTQAVMVAIMTMTPVHMADQGLGLGATGVVISLHVAAMFLPSPISGRLADRFGRRTMLAVAAGTLLAAGLVAAAAGDSTALLAAGLVLLGLGWSFGLAAGTALITDAAPLARRARVQGTADLCVALAGAGGGLASGFVVDLGGYPTLSLVGALLALGLLPLLVGARERTAAAPRTSY